MRAVAIEVSYGTIFRNSSSAPNEGCCEYWKVLREEEINQADKSL